MMTKYYVASGTFRLVVQANEARGAAIWAVHRGMCQLMPFLTDETPQFLSLQSQPLELENSVRVSERGFESDEFEEFDTFEIMTEWNQLMVALSRLESHLTPEPVGV